MMCLILLACSGSGDREFKLFTAEESLSCVETNNGLWLKCQAPDGFEVSISQSRNHDKHAAPLVAPFRACTVSDRDTTDGGRLREVNCTLEGDDTNYSTTALILTPVDEALFVSTANELIQRLRVKAFDDACRKATGQPCAPLELPR